MLPTNSIKYADFEYEGEKVFAGVAGTDIDENGIPDGNNEITFMKKKFFQSALKHIL